MAAAALSPRHAPPLRAPRHARRCLPRGAAPPHDTVHPRSATRRGGGRKRMTRAAQRAPRPVSRAPARSEEHTSELQSRVDLVCRLLLEKKKKNKKTDCD